MSVDTPGRSLLDITRRVAEALKRGGAQDGLATLFIRHTSASLVVGENTDSDVRADLLDAFDRLAPEDAPWRHAAEGPDDMPAHVKAAITATSLAVPVIDGRMRLGTWQAIYLAEHRARPYRREVALHFAGSLEGA